MPLRTAYKLCPEAIFVDGHRERYVEYSHKYMKILQKFSPRVEMASIDEAYLDLTGTERLLGPPLAAAHTLHQRRARGNRPELFHRRGILATGSQDRVRSSQPHGILWIPPEARLVFWRLSTFARSPESAGNGEHLHACGVRKIGDLARLDESLLEEHFGKWGLALAGKAPARTQAPGLTATSPKTGQGGDPNRSATRIRFRWTRPTRASSTPCWCGFPKMVARRLRDHQLYTRTVQIKLRFTRIS